ncbi:MAG: 23S rRNA (adenine(2503)-C2)-methyltransferase, partial [Anaerolineae bacterium]|nr:23S rRNA (adenine(2503)-C2)-methyltransferase [Anaerolineae bacterium]
MNHLYNLTLDELTALVTGWGHPAYRARQLWHWLYVQKAAAFSDMTNLPSGLVADLEAQAALQVLEPVRDLYSSDGETVKWLFQLPDGQLIETVLMDYADGRRTACISSQA